LGSEQRSLLGDERLVLVPVELAVNLIPLLLQLCPPACIGSLPALVFELGQLAFESPALRTEIDRRSRLAMFVTRRQEVQEHMGP